MVRDAQRLKEGSRVETPMNQLEILPTVVGMLGYIGKKRRLPGALAPLPAEASRTLMSSCWNESACPVSIKGDEKYIHHYGDRPEELFDLSEDPLEKQPCR
jgi:lipoteichoic acid synthase